jgi:multidrug efflux pump
MGSRYVNDFNRFNRTWAVVVQADSNFRNQINDLRKLKVRNRHRQMLPLGSIADVHTISGPLVLTRYNMYPAAAITANVKQGISTGQGIESFEELSRKELPNSMSIEWTELAYLETTSSNTGMFVFVLSVAFVFLVLAALYESWSLPLVVILVVPMCVLSAIIGVAVNKLDINIFTQIGLIVLIGLACKNAILIVEFAKYRRETGSDARTAILSACESRLRPIIMTSCAFILGVLPLVFAHGAGAEMRKALGVAVFYGMLGVTLFGIILTPVFFIIIDRLTAGRRTAVQAAWDIWRDPRRLPLFDRVGCLWDRFKLAPARRKAAAAVTKRNYDHAASQLENPIPVAELILGDPPLPPTVIKPTENPNESLGS